MADVPEKISRRNAMIILLIGIIILLLLFYRRMFYVEGRDYDAPELTFPGYQYAPPDLVAPDINYGWGQTTDLACSCAGGDATFYDRPGPMFTAPQFVYISTPPTPGFQVEPLAMLPPPQYDFPTLQAPEPEKYWMIFRDNGHGMKPLWQTEDGNVFLLQDYHYHEHHNFKPYVNWQPKEAYVMDSNRDIIYGTNRYVRDPSKDEVAPEEKPKPPLVWYG